MLREYLSNIADKFRTYLDTTELINAQDFAGKVEDVAVRYNQLGFTSGYNQGLKKGTEQGKPLGKLELLQDSEYMNAKVSGTAIAVNDVSPIEHSVGCTLSRKNILNPYSYELTRGDVVVEDDGSIVLYGGMETGGEIIYTVNLVDTYVLSFGVQTDFNGVTIYVDGYNSTEDFKNNATLGLATTSVFREHTHEIKLIQASQTTSQLYIQLEKGPTATAYTQYIADLSTVEVKRYGKNLLPNDFSDFENWKAVGSGRVYDLILPTGECTFSFKTKSQGDINYGFLYIQEDGASKFYPIQNQKFNNVTFRVRQGHKYSFWCSGAFLNELKKYHYDWQLERGATVTDYEPCNEQTKIANAYGIVNGVTSVSPNMTLISNTGAVVINANYLRDIDTYIDNLKTNVALTGGE